MFNKQHIKLLIYLVVYIVKKIRNVAYLYTKKYSVAYFFQKSLLTLIEQTECIYEISSWQSRYNKLEVIVLEDFSHECDYQKLHDFRLLELWNILIKRLRENV